LISHSSTLCGLYRPFYGGKKHFFENLKGILHTSFLSTGMKINMEKSLMMAWGLNEEE
jgi:hypothetical protein